MPLPSTASHTMNVQSTLEQGFGVQVTKIGPGQKEEAYAMPKQRARWVVIFVVVALVILSVLVGVYAGLFNDERIRRFYESQQAARKVEKETVDQSRLIFELHKKEAERDHQEEDTQRAFKRIMGVVGRKFDELLENANQDAAFASKLKEAKDALTSYVNEELVDFEKQKRAYDIEAKKRLEKLAQAQEQSLRELLRTMSGVKMEALEDMLEEVFAAGQKAPLLEVSDYVVEQIEELADALYEEKENLESGRAKLDKVRNQIKGELPDELTKQFSDARDADELAESLDELVEITKLARGKKEIAVIEEKWRRSIDKAREDAKNGNTDDDEDDYDPETKSNVDAILAVQKLVAEGKVPVHLLDFEAIDLSDDDDDDSDDSSDNQDNQDNQDNGQKQN